MVADPKLTPCTFTAVLVDVVAPGWMKKLVDAAESGGGRVTFVGSLLVSVMKTPFGPAGDDKVTGNGVERPGPTVTLVGSTIAGPLTVVVASPVDFATSTSPKVSRAML